MILFLAVNGITEAYAHAVMNPNELASANIVLLVSKHHVHVLDSSELTCIPLTSLADYFGI